MVAWLYLSAHPRPAIGPFPVLSLPFLDDGYVGVDVCFFTISRPDSSMLYSITTVEFPGGCYRIGSFTPPTGVRSPEDALSKDLGSIKNALGKRGSYS